MLTVWVWVAVIYSGFDKGAYLTVDNIASREDCNRIVSKAVDSAPTQSRGFCVQYRKVVAK